MKYKGIIFDLDGTLVNTIEDISDSMNQVLESYGKDKFTYEEYKKKIGRGFRNLVGQSFLEDEIEEALGKLSIIYGENYMKKSKAYDGIEDLLKELEVRGIKLAINSNKRDDYTKQMAKELFPTIEFVRVLGQREGIEVKPDPAAAYEILEAMGLDKSQVIYIGDSNVDILTGKNAKLTSLGVDWGFRGEKELLEYGADHIAYRPADILNYI